MLQSVRALLNQGDNLAIVALAAGFFVLILTALIATQAVRLKKLSHRLELMTIGADSSSLADTLTETLRRLAETEHRTELVEHSVGVLQAKMPGCVQRVGMIRFDAFENVGGQQSFSIAMLDGQSNGIVLTSMFSRTDIRVYAKSIKNGLASHPLSQEEEQALKEAR